MELYEPEPTVFRDEQMEITTNHRWNDMETITDLLDAHPSTLLDIKQHNISGWRFDNTYFIEYCETKTREFIENTPPSVPLFIFSSHMEDLLFKQPPRSVDRLERDHDKRLRISFENDPSDNFEILTEKHEDVLLSVIIPEKLTPAIETDGNRIRRLSPFSIGSKSPKLTPRSPQTEFPLWK
jgi:hypothetical protein